MKKELLEQIEKQHGINKNNILSVSQVSEYIQNKLSTDSKLNQIYVLGEVTNASESKSGFLFFDIKDEKSLLSCIIFPENNSNLSFEIEDGLDVLVFGSIITYKKKSIYQLKVLSVSPVGEGAFYLKFKQLKEKLSNEGLFDEEHKKELPPLPRCIGVITSKTSSACKDIMEILRNRFSNIIIKLIDTSTQGVKASQGIINAIKTLNRIGYVDIIILARGGGSIEDLMCFNDENLARAIFASKIPIVTGIGHETDYTIADFVADERAPTPSVAAKLAVPDKKDLADKINSVRDKLRKSYDNFIKSYQREKEIKEREKEIKERKKEIKEKEKKLKRYKIAIIVLILLILLFITIILLGGL